MKPHQGEMVADVSVVAGSFTAIADGLALAQESLAIAQDAK